MKKLLILLLMCAAGAFAQTATTRLVTLSWTDSTNTNVTGYIILSSTTSNTGPFAQIGCTGTVPGSTCVSGTIATTNNYSDIETIGTTVYYELETVTPVCTSSTPITTPCGNSVPTPVVTVPIPPRPATPTGLTGVVQ